MGVACQVAFPCPLEGSTYGCGRSGHMPSTRSSECRTHPGSCQCGREGSGGARSPIPGLLTGA
ncbi:hypothetical protein ACP4OV_007021 [Aristida adscensionis]